MKRLIVPDPSGRLQLYGVTAGGLQVDIEAWSTAEAARDWCYQTGSKASFRLDEISVSARELLLLTCLTDDPQTVEDLQPLIEKKEEEIRASRKGAPFAFPRPTLIVVRNACNRLQRHSLAKVKAPRRAEMTLLKRAAMTTVARTNTGQELLSRFH